METKICVTEKKNRSTKMSKMKRPRQMKMDTQPSKTDGFQQKQS